MTSSTAFRANLYVVSVGGRSEKGMQAPPATTPFRNFPRKKQIAPDRQVASYLYILETNSNNSMATVSMQAGETAFGNMSLQLSPAFRSASENALRERQRQTDLQKMRELARSDEFSDDESDGEESDDENEEDEEEKQENLDTFENRRPSPASVSLTPRRHSPYHRTQPNHTTAAAATSMDTIDLSDDDIDVKETMFVPFRQPVRSERSPRMDRFMQKRIVQQQRRQTQEPNLSPKVRRTTRFSFQHVESESVSNGSTCCDVCVQGDDWTIVDKSPTFERLLQRKLSEGSDWFAQRR
jgi:hypothetical protein